MLRVSRYVVAVTSTNRALFALTQNLALVLTIEPGNLFVNGAIYIATAIQLFKFNSGERFHSQMLKTIGFAVYSAINRSQFPFKSSLLCLFFYSIQVSALLQSYLIVSDAGDVTIQIGRGH